jgi:hypothetical protein
MIVENVKVDIDGPNQKIRCIKNKTHTTIELNDVEYSGNIMVHEYDHKHIMLEIYINK